MALGNSLELIDILDVSVPGERTPEGTLTREAFLDIIDAEAGGPPAEGARVTRIDYNTFSWSEVIGIFLSNGATEILTDGSRGRLYSTE